MLGHTLGNFEINDILYQIRSSMQKGDVFVFVSGVGNEKWKKWAEFWEKSAEGSERDKSKSGMNEFFIHIPLQLGLDRKDIEFGARFKNSRIEYYYTIKKEKIIEFQGKKIRFNEGDQIVVAVSYKHETDDLLSILNVYFGEVNLKLSQDGSTAIGICVL